MPRWTPEAREAQRQRCQLRQPWKSSTGPKTQQGKQNTRMNALKSGKFSMESKRASAERSGFYRNLSALMRELKSLL